MSDLNGTILNYTKIKIGDYLVLQYTDGESMKGARINGKVTDICPRVKQVQLNHGWCGHDGDLIVEHKVNP